MAQDNNKHKKRIQFMLGAIGNLKEALFGFLFGTFTHPSFTALILTSLAGPIIFVSAGLLEAAEFGLELTDAVISKDASKQRLTDLATSFAKMCLVGAAVGGSLLAANIFTAQPILGMAGGLTPFLFTAAMSLVATVQLGSAAYFAYKAFKSTDPEKRKVYYDLAKQRLIGGLMTTVAVVAVATLMLNPVTGPAMAIIAATASTIFAADFVWRNRQSIGAFFKRVGSSISSLFASKSLDDNKQPLLEDSQSLNGGPHHVGQLSINSAGDGPSTAPLAITIASPNSGANQKYRDNSKIRINESQQASNSVGRNQFSLLGSSPRSSVADRMMVEAAQNTNAPTL